MKNAFKIVISLVILAAIIGWFWYDFHFSSNTIVDAIEEAAIEDYEQVYQMIDTASVGDKTVCVFESRSSGFGMSVLENKGTEEKPKYHQIAFQHIPFTDVNDDLSNFYVLDQDENIKILCGMIKNIDEKFIYVNGTQVQLCSYQCEDMQETIYCWIFSCNVNEEVKVSFN